MSERISSCQISKIEHIGEDALEIIDQTYGEGYPTWGHGHHELSYHNGHHGRAVGEAALKMCVDMELGDIENVIAHTAGYAHDLIQGKGRGKDEAASAAWLERKLRQKDISQRHIQMGALAIKGTEPVFQGKKIVGQKATQLRYPDKDSEKVGLSVACGDFGELYTPEGPYLAHQLFREIKGMPDEDVIPFEDMTAFQQGQVELLESWRYPLKRANTLLTTHKRQVIRYSHNTLKQLEDGTIETWGDLLQRDKKFIEQHA